MGEEVLVGTGVVQVDGVEALVADLDVQADLLQADLHEVGLPEVAYAPVEDLEGVGLGLGLDRGRYGHVGERLGYTEDRVLHEGGDWELRPARCFKREADN